MMNSLNFPLEASALNSKRMNGVYTHEFLLVYSRINTNTSPLVSCLSNQSLYSQKSCHIRQHIFPFPFSRYFVAGNVDPTPPRPPKAPAKPAARLALTSHTTSAIPVAAPDAVPGTVSVPRPPSTIQSVVPVRADDDKRERRTTSNCSRSNHRDHYSPRSTPRSERCRSVGTARSVSQVRGPPPGQWDVHTGLWDPYVGNITRHGPDEAALRALSEGRFVGIICAKSVAESVFGSQILKTLRDQGIDIDATAESLHRQLAPQQGIPNRTDKPIEFMAPLVQFIADKLKAQCPVKQDTAAMRKLQETEAKLQAAKTKLVQAGILDRPQRSRRTTGTFAPDPKLPTDDDGPGSAGSVVSVSPAVVSTSLRKRSTRHWELLRKRCQSKGSWHLCSIRQPRHQKT